MFLLDASYRSGRLLVGYWGTVGKTIYADKSVRTDISVARGDSRGATSKVIGTIPVANNWPPQNPSAIPTGPVVYGKLTPSGLVVVEIFQYTRGNYSPLAAAVVPSGR